MYRGRGVSPMLPAGGRWAGHAPAIVIVGGAAGLLACANGVTWMLSSGRLHRREDARFLLTLGEMRPLSVVQAMEPTAFNDHATATTPIRMPDPDANPDRPA